MRSVQQLRRSDELARELGDRDAEKVKAAMETEKQAAEREQMSEINLFTLDPNGFKTHWKIVAGTSGETLNQMMKNQGLLSNWLKEHEYKPDEINRGGVAAAPAAPVGPVCNDCGGPMEHKSGTGKKGKWSGWFCIATANVPQAQRHAPVWE